MADFESQLTRWQAAGVLDADAAERIRAYESKRARPSGLRWEGLVALILGAMLLACGVVLFVTAHWDQIGPAGRYAIVTGMVAVFHLGGALARKSYHALSTALHAVGTLSTGAAIALVGQIFNIQEHWPAAVLMWALAAFAGWALLRDEAQQTLALLLLPAWILAELGFYADGHVDQNTYLARFLIVWAVLYLTLFLGSRRAIVRGILFAASAIAVLVGSVMQIEGFRAWSATQSAMPFHVKVWGWVAIAALPLAVSLFRFGRSFVPVAAAVVFGSVLPWCFTINTHHFGVGAHHETYRSGEPNLAAHALVAAFSVFIIWWGVRQASKALVNLGMVGFALAVAWFYFSNLFDKMGRSLGLIGLGVLFLAGGWALEKMRRSLLARMVAETGTGLNPEEELP
jgi:uncharacterized membrane protein